MTRPEQLIQAEEILVIETPERVPLTFSLASIGNRFIAVAIDHAIQYTLIFVVMWVCLEIAGVSVFGSGGAGIEQLPNWTIAIMLLIVFALFIGYFIAFEMLWNGQTPGKRLMKLRVIRDDGRPITIWESVARNVLRMFDAIPGFLIPVYSVGLIVVFLSPRDQRVGDAFAGTVVIRERTDEAPAFKDVFSSRITDSALIRVKPHPLLKIDISTVTPDEIDVVETFLRRRWDLADRHRDWMAWRVALPLMYKLKPGYDTETFSYEGFLEELLHRFNARKRYIN